MLSDSGAEYTRQHDQFLSSLARDCFKAAGVTVSLEVGLLFGQYAQGDKPGSRVDILAALMPTPGGLFRQVVRAEAHARRHKRVHQLLAPIGRKPYEAAARC